MKKLRKVNKLINERVRYLADKGFQYDTARQVWIKGNRIIEMSLVNDIYISTFKKIVDRVDSQGNFIAKVGTRTKKQTKRLKNRGKHLDAMDYRLPGSFGTGKKR